MTKDNFLDKWIEALPLNSKDAIRKEMAYDIDLMIQKFMETIEEGGLIKFDKPKLLHQFKNKQ